MTFAAGSTSPDSADVREYNRLRRRLTVADSVISIIFLVVLLVTGWNGTLRDWTMHAAPESYSLQVFYYVLMLFVISKVIDLPLDYYKFRLEHQFQLSNQRLRSWVKDEAKMWVIGLIIAAILVEMIYNLIRISPTYWWVIAWLVYNGLAVFFAQIAPVIIFPLFYKFQPLENDELSKRLIALSERAGKRVRGVYEWNLSEKSRKANAALAGLGATRRIILADTLIQHYTPDEIEAVLAHELGHHVHNHILKTILLQAGISFLGFGIVAQALEFALDHRLFEIDRLHDFASVPFVVLLTTVMSFLLMPILNAYSRQKEREADRYSLSSIPAVDPFISSMNKLAEQNLAERAPSRFVEIWFHSHPPVGKRIAAAQAWSQTHSPQMNPN